MLTRCCSNLFKTHVIHQSTQRWQRILIKFNVPRLGDGSVTLFFFFTDAYWHYKAPRCVSLLTSEAAHTQIHAHTPSQAALCVFMCSVARWHARLVVSTPNCSSPVLKDVMVPILCDVTELHRGQTLFMLLLWDWLMRFCCFFNVLDNLYIFFLCVCIVSLSQPNKVIQNCWGFFC